MKGSSTRNLTLRDGRNLAYSLLGASGARPLLYCHGMPGSRYEMDWALSTTTAEGWRLIVPERPGYGGSCTSRDYSFSRWVHDTAELLDACAADRINVLGYSAGGAYALALAAAMPDRLGHICLVSSIAPFDTPDCFEGMAPGNREMLDLARRDIATLATLFAPFAEQPKRLSDSFVAGLAEVDRTFLEAQPLLRRQFEESAQRALLQGLPGLLSDLTLITGGWEDVLQSIELPVTLWHGSADTNVPPAMSRALQNRLINSTLNTVPSHGHLLLHAQWDEILDKSFG